MISLDAVSPLVLGGFALGALVLMAIAAFILLSIVAFVRKKYRSGSPGSK